MLPRPDHHEKVLRFDVAFLPTSLADYCAMDLQSLWEINKTRFALEPFDHPLRIGLWGVNADERFDVATIFTFLNEPQQVNRFRHAPVSTGPPPLPHPTQSRPAATSPPSRCKTQKPPAPSP